MRPSKLWKQLTPDTRLAAAHAFWDDDESTEAQMSQLEAAAAIARRLNFRLKSVRNLPTERLARSLAQMNDVSDSVAGRALVAFHFGSRRALMAAFLDALQVPHDDGLITAENLAAPETARLQTAIETVRAAFPADDVDLYLRTLVALDGDTWSNLEGLIPATT